MNVFWLKKTTYSDTSIKNIDILPLTSFVLPIRPKDGILNRGIRVVGR